MNRPLARTAKSLAALTFVAFMLAGVVTAFRHPEIVSSVTDWIRGSGWRGPFAFVAVYIVGVMIFLPGSVLSVAGGALFGPVVGPIYSFTGALVGATLSFLVARYWGHGWLSARLSRRLHGVVLRAQARGWRLVAFVRLVPVLPFGVVNYGLGLLGLRLAHFVTVSALCMLPGTLAYGYLGYAGHQALHKTPSDLPGIAAGAITAVLVLVAIPLLIKRFRHSKHETENALTTASPATPVP